MTNSFLIAWGMAAAGLVAPGIVVAQGFRGDGSGRFAATAPLVEYATEKNVIWKTKLPAWSNASPIAMGDRLFVCGEPAVLVCLRANDGSVLWQAANGTEELLGDADKALLRAEQERADQCAKLMRETQDKLGALSREIGTSDNKAKFDAQVEELTAKLQALRQAWQPMPLAQKHRLPSAHGNTGYSTPTPVTDGRLVWVVFGNGVAACYTPAGERKWIKLVERPSQGHGHSASPVLAGGQLILAINEVHGLDPATGEERWHAPSAARFGTPVAATIGQVPVVVTANGELLRATDGRVLAAKLGGLAYNSPVVADGVAYFVNEGQATAWKLPSETGESFVPKKLWETAIGRERQYASPAVHNGLLFALAANGNLTVLDAQTGAKVLEHPLKLNGTCYSSLMVIGDRLHVFSEGGSTVVLTADREVRELMRAAVESVRSSPLFFGQRLYLRSMNHLFCFGAE